MKLLVLAQYAEGALTLETRATIAAAQLPGVEVYLLLAGEAVSEIAFQAAQACGDYKNLAGSASGIRAFVAGEPRCTHRKSRYTEGACLQPYPLRFN